MMQGMNPTPAPPAVTVYGIPNCDTVKKARAWLADASVDHVFVDFKKHGVPGDQLPRWMSALGWDTLLNRKGTTWRQLDDDARAAVIDATTASALMLAHPSVVKRPVVVWRDASVSVGFDADCFRSHLP